MLKVLINLTNGLEIPIVGGGHQAILHFESLPRPLAKLRLESAAIGFLTFLLDSGFIKELLLFLVHLDAFSVKSLARIFTFFLNRGVLCFALLRFLSNFLGLFGRWLGSNVFGLSILLSQLFRDSVLLMKPFKSGVILIQELFSFLCQDFWNFVNFWVVSMIANHLLILHK